MTTDCPTLCHVIEVRDEKGFIARIGPAGAFAKKPTVLACQETCGRPLNLILISG